MLIKRIPDVSGLVPTTVFITKIRKAKSKILDASGLVTTTILITKIGEVENKIPDTSGLVKKTDYAKISDIENKYLITSDYNKIYKRKSWCKDKRKGISW